MIVPAKHTRTHGVLTLVILQLPLQEQVVLVLGVDNFLELLILLLGLGPLSLFAQHGFESLLQDLLVVVQSVFVLH